jgi:2,4-dienoyl-CoA reductase (NADPH2)
MLDLVEGGGTFDETVQLAQAIEAAGATIINTGIGWHEARIPTIATPVPRAAFSWVTRKLKGAVSIPLVTTNRINDPQVADDDFPRRCRYGVDGAPVPGRCRTAVQSAKRPRG